MNQNLRQVAGMVVLELSQGGWWLRLVGILLLSLSAKKYIQATTSHHQVRFGMTVNVGSDPSNPRFSAYRYPKGRFRLQGIKESRVRIYRLWCLYHDHKI